MKVYISQPMKDIDNSKIRLQREMAIRKCLMLFHCPIEVINSFFENAPVKENPLWYLGESIKLLSEADVVYFCKDWEKYNGCTIEHECAVRYGKECIYA